MRLILPVGTVVAIAACRAAGCRSPGFQAVAHLYTGVLFGSWIGTNFRREPLALALVLCAVEVACFCLLPK